MQLWSVRVLPCVPGAVSYLVSFASRPYALFRINGLGNTVRSLMLCLVRDVADWRERKGARRQSVLGDGPRTPARASPHWLP